ncbi:hypothetical protein [Dictyobacter formicarum]|uniref:hypothetical protein n=1 Tax=Dictyobacter formicarum TaxID=2778368 RepID=UPI00191583A5|nr:hypothetical protein [Dictyobacter formicarum]
MAVATEMDKKHIALPLLSGYSWNQGVIRTAVRRWFGEKQPERAPPQTSLRQRIIPRL